MLKESEWLTINNVLLDLYTIDNLDKFSMKLMKALKMLIPYSKGYILMLDDNKKIIRGKSCFIGMDTGVISEYIDKYYDDDYLNYIYEIAVETMVYKDTDIMDDALRKKTDFFKQFLEPVDIPFGCGIIVIKSNQVMAAVSLFRNKQMGDFNDKDLFMLEILKKHIKNILYKCSNETETIKNFGKRFKDVSKEYGLTERESHIMQLIANGMSNQEICDHLTISMSTVKKHIYNIFTKCRVNSRTQLLNYLFQNGELK